ncbi:MAG: hypothetical protein ACFFAN_08430 [Promethearchaeota archaeon]
MICIHGLDEISCPICSIIGSSIPKKFLKIKELYRNDLKPYNPFLKQNSIKKEEFFSSLTSKKANFRLNLISITPKLKLINKLPNFENKMFLERLKEIDTTKLDPFRISKKIPLESPEINLKKEE